MQLHQIKPRHIPKSKKPRVGRGGKRGTTSGHGTKGQKSRSGRRIRPAERDFIQRLPKLRGFKNKPFRPKPQVVNLKNIEKSVSGDLVNPKILKDSGLVRSADKPIKILGQGTFKKKMTFEGVKFSKKAISLIEASGGKVA